MNKLATNDDLHSAVAEKKLKLLKILLEGGSEVNRRAYDGKTALVIICCNFGVDYNEEYTISVITLLLKHNADPNVQDRKGRTAIMYAVHNLKPKSVVDLLLKHGADPLICDNLGKNAISLIRKEYWSQYFDCFSQFVEPPIASIGNTNVETIKAFRPSQTKEKRIHSLGYQENIRRLKTTTKLDVIKDKTSDNDIDWYFSDDIFCPHTVPSVKEEAVTGENAILRRVSHFPGHKNEDRVCSLVFQEAEFGNARQEPSTNDTAMFNTDEKERRLMFGRIGGTSNSDNDISSMDINFLKNGTARCFPKLPPIEKISNDAIKNT